MHDPDQLPLPDPLDLVYKKAFMAMNLGFSLLDIQFDELGQAYDVIIRDANPAQNRIDGLPALIGQRVREFLPDIEPKWIERYAQIIRSGQAAHFEDWSQANQRWYEVNAFPVDGAGHSLVAIIYNDITLRKRHEEALHQSEARQRAVLESAKEYAIFTTDLDRRVTSWSRGAQAVFGYTEVEILHQSADQLFTSEDQQQGAAQREAQQATSQGQAANERWHCRQDGSRFYGSGVVTPLRDETGTIIGFVKVMRDLTRQKQAEQALRQNEAQQTYLVKLSDTLRPLGNASLIESEAIRLLGEELGTSRVFYASLEANGESGTIRQDYVNGIPSGVGHYSISTFAPGFVAEWRAGRPTITTDVNTDPRFGESERAAYASVSSRAAVGMPLLKEGRLIAILGINQATPRQWTEFEIALIRETLERMWAAAERARVEEALKEADRRKDEFLAMLAHELRNPMSTLRSGLQILALINDNDETSRATITMMSRQTDHLVRMVDDLLDVSRISQGKIELKKERVNLVELVGQAAQSVKTLYQEQGRRLRMDLPDAPMYVEGDGARLSQVVTNLLTNGARYTEENGQVWLRLAPQAGSSGDQEALIEVRDNGIGLAADQIGTIFELFVQVDHSLARSKGGLGVGLTLVKRLVEMHGGWVEVQSEGVGKGSTFRVHLPMLTVIPERALMSNKNVSAEAPAHRILVVDDNADAGLTLSMLLKLKGYEVYSRTSGQAGLEAGAALQPGAILLDIGMPSMDGYETCRLIRQQVWGKSAVVIALSGYGQEEDRMRTQASGFDGHLVKPVDLEALLKLLTNLLNKPGENQH